MPQVGLEPTNLASEHSQTTSYTGWPLCFLCSHKALLNTEHWTQGFNLHSLSASMFLIYHSHKFDSVTQYTKRLQLSRGRVPAFGKQVHGFKPGRSRRIFKGEKILSTPSFRREVKPLVPCRRFTACKRSLNVTWKSGIFRQNSSAISRPSGSSFH